MNTEEKAKAYDEALKRAKAAFDIAADKDLVGGVVRTIFPELYESEDERIRKALIDGVRQIRCKNGITQEQMLAYLEKQKKCVAYSSKISADEDGKIRVRLIEYFQGFLEGYEDCYKDGGCVKWEGLDVKSILAWLEKQKETADSFTDGIIEVRSFQRGMEEGRKLETQKEPGIKWLKSDNVKNPDKPYVDKAGMFYTTDGRMCYASEIEQQKEQKEIPLMNGDADLFFDEWNQQHSNSTKRECFEAGVLYAVRLLTEDSPMLEEFKKGLEQVILWGKEGYKVSPDGTTKSQTQDEIDEVLDEQKEQKPNIEICPHSIKSKSYKENGYPIEDCDYGLEIAQDILEKTLGKVEGYQSDDGIREHQTAIQAVKDAMKEQKPSCWNSPVMTNEMIMNEQKPDSLIYDKDLDKAAREFYLSGGADSPVDSTGLVPIVRMAEFGATWMKDRMEKEQKPAEWSEEDEKILKGIIGLIDHNQHYDVSNKDMLAWLKSLPERFNLQSKQEQNDYITPHKEFFKFIYDRLINVHKENPNVDYMRSFKERLNNLSFGEKQEWSEEDEEMFQEALTDIIYAKNELNKKGCEGLAKSALDAFNWLNMRFKSLRPQPQGIYQQVVKGLRDMCDRYEQNGMFTDERARDFLGNVRVKCKDAIECAAILDEPSWKPSEAQLMALHSVIDDESDTIGNEQLKLLYNDLKKL